MAAIIDFAGVKEATFLHYTARSGIVHEEVAPDSVEALHVEAVVNQQLQCFGADAFVPVGLGNPIACLGVVLANIDVAFSMGIIAYTANGLASFLQLNSPDMVAMKNGADNVQTILYALMWWPASSWSYIRVGGLFEKGFCIVFTPRTQ